MLPYAWSGRFCSSRSLACVEPVPGSVRSSVVRSPAAPPASARPSASDEPDGDDRPPVARAEPSEVIQGTRHDRSFSGSNWRREPRSCDRRRGRQGAPPRVSPRLSQPVSEPRELEARADAELAVRVAEVQLDGLLGHEQALGDRAVRELLRRGEVADAPLGRGERLGPVSSSRGGRPPPAVSSARACSASAWAPQLSGELHRSRSVSRPSRRCLRRVCSRPSAAARAPARAAAGDGSSTVTASSSRARPSSPPIAAAAVRSERPSAPGAPTCRASATCSRASARGLLGLAERRQRGRGVGAPVARPAQPERFAPLAAAEQVGHAVADVALRDPQPAAARQVLVQEQAVLGLPERAAPLEAAAAASRSPRSSSTAVATAPSWGSTEWRPSTARARGRPRPARRRARRAPARSPRAGRG